MPVIKTVNIHNSCIYVISGSSVKIHNSCIYVISGSSVIPAKAGISSDSKEDWIPAFAGAKQWRCQPKLRSLLLAKKIGFWIPVFTGLDSREGRTRRNPVKSFFSIAVSKKVLLHKCGYSQLFLLFFSFCGFC